MLAFMPIPGHLGSVGSFERKTVTLPFSKADKLAYGAYLVATHQFNWIQDSRSK
jgi:hypothetical protein